MRSVRLMMMNQKKQTSKDFHNKSTIEFNSENKKNPPYFFKIILSPLSQRLKLRIPKDFVEKYRRHFSNEIYLNVPNSEQPWKVELQKEDDNMFLEGKNWQNLMEFYKIVYSHFLVFRFDGGSPSHFHVLIFDKTCTEIDYPLRSSCDQKKRKFDSKQVPKKGLKAETIEDDDGGDGDDVSIEILDKPAKSSTKRKQVESVVDLDSSNSDVIGCSTYRRKGVALSPATRKKLIMKKLDALESSYPHFKVVLLRSHVGEKNYLSVPISHARIHFPSNIKDIKLIGPDGKSYHVRCYMDERRAHFSEWRAFVSDYDLEMGDACMFELIDPGSYTYKVSIVKL